MKFQFKIQPYQTDAVENTAGVFAGQPAAGPAAYRREAGRGRLDFDETGYRNAEVALDAGQLLANIRTVQERSGIPLSDRLAPTGGMGACSLDIEMETGTGKTYVYIKTMFELNKRYGWSKFVVVVPSIAIREGVAKSFAMLEDHFMEHYGKKARHFVYDSGCLNRLDSFAGDAGISVMVINTQAFASSLKEGGRSKESRIIYDRRDAFGSRRPIDVIAANRPIVIMDEPQKMEGGATRRGLENFKPLFVLNYSATHKTRHNTVYALDALDAYRMRLVKRIQVKGFELKNLQGTGAYLYLDSIVLSKREPPRARIELEVGHGGGIRRETRTMGAGGDLFAASGLNAYKGYVVSEIDPARGTVTFRNGATLRRGEVTDDKEGEALQRVQIRETIRSHFEKERELFGKGIKTLSLFFIDEVAKYKSYDAQGNAVKGKFQQFFEEEYAALLDKCLPLFDDAYQAYLRRFPVQEIHNGYFSIDKKSGHAIDSKPGRRGGLSDDISAYDLILKDKERLLSFDEPTRFIFSHSALREGWDNPNVFQICTLRHSNSEVNKRQEVGRGLRLCVDKDGNRMDHERLGDSVHDVNRLTVIANESYSSFVDDLQRDTRESLRERPKQATAEYFKGKTLPLADGGTHTLTDREAGLVKSYLDYHSYIDEQGAVTTAYKRDWQENRLAPLPWPELQRMAQGIHALVRGTYEEDALLAGMIEDGNRTLSPENRLNANFAKKEFQELWRNINHKYVYTVHYDSRELVRKAIGAIDKELHVTELSYVMTVGAQQAADQFGGTRTTTSRIGTVSTSGVKYDLVGEIAKGATLTRRTVVDILRGIKQDKLYMFRNNPEEFIRKTIRIVREQKATMIVEHIRYDKTEETYDSTVFTQEKHTQPVGKDYYPAEKHVMDYVFPDSKGEREFAESLDGATEVCVYAKLPRAFRIPTPVGSYSPDWAIAFREGTVKHIFFIAETKGSMDTMELRGVEEAKVRCAKKLFNEASTSHVRYHQVSSYQDLLDVMEKLD